MIWVLILSFGLVVGSFVNVLVWRLPKGESILGRSKCLKCKTQIAWFDNIPLLSYFLLRARCRSCKNKISVQYPTVELATALLFLISYCLLPIAPFIYFALLIPILVAIFVIDVKHQIIPDSLVFIGLFFSLFVIRNTLYVSLLAGFSAALFLLILHLITRGRGMGLGDVKFAILGGMIVGLSHLLAWFFVAYLTGAVVGIILILTKDAKLKTKIAFGPFLVFALFVVVLFGV